MADITLGTELSKRLDERYAELQERRVSERQSAENLATQQAEAARRTQKIQQNQAAQATSDTRRLDAEQRLREQQLKADLDRIEQNQLIADQAALQQAALEQVVRASQTPNRGVIVDLYA